MRDAAAGFGVGAAVDEVDGFLQFLGTEVVEQDDIRTGFKNRGNLIDGVDFHFNSELLAGAQRKGNGIR